ncbi:MAG: efflux RND transporter permease subunit [Methylocystis sp.]
MAFKVSSLAIKHPLPSIVFSIILLFLGFASFLRLPITRLPTADIPMISVAVSQFGAAPAEIEAQVTRIIEDGVSGVAGVRHISSTITDGLSVTTIIFRLETSSDKALNDVKDAVTRVRFNLPRNIGEPLIQRVDVVGLPIVTYAASAPGKSPEQVSWFMENTVKRRLQDIKGVAQAEIIGGVTREILVSLDADRLQAFGLSAFDISRRLRGTNVTVTGGRAEIGGRDQSIRTVASAKTLGEFAGTMIALTTGGEVRLKDLGTITDTIADQRTFARLDGKPVVAIGIKRASGASDVEVAAAVQKRVDQLNAENPEFDITLIDTSVEVTRGNYDAAIHTLFEGAFLAVVIVYLFLRDLRATIIVAVSLPLSIFPAFWVMDVMGFSLNLVSFLAITLSTGILVDDSIVEIENIVRHMRMGRSAREAASDAADEIGVAVIAISLTIIAIFVPASFMPGIAGQFFKQFGITVAVQVLFSLLAARFVTPILAAYFMKPHQSKEEEPGPVLRAYERLVTLSVHRSLATCLIGAAIFAASIASIMLLSKGFLPAQDSARSVMAVELPPGSQLSEMEQTTEDIAAAIHTLPEVTRVFVDGGRIAQGPQETRRASLIISYTPKGDRETSQLDLERQIGQLLRKVPDIRYYFVDENGLRAISLVAQGAEPQAVANVANELARQMRRIPGVENVIADTTLDRPELIIHPHLDLAARLGVTPEVLAETIRVATIGDVGPALARFTDGDRSIPVRVQLEDRARMNINVLGQLRVPMGQSGSIPLTAVADLKFNQGPTNINRYDRNRQATVEADLVGGAALGDVLAEIQKLPVMNGLPPGVTVGESGDAESLNELGDDFARALSAGLMMVYALLVLLFGSFLLPLTILFSLPLSLGGAVFALMLSGKQLTVPVWIGIMMLMGIVTKNAIMLVDFALASVRDGAPADVAIIDAGRKRARPIVMTTIAMVAGMTPSALAFGIGGEFRSPMAIAVIGGLIFSTLLSLIFVPAVFMVVMRLGQRLASLGAWSGIADSGARPSDDHFGKE